MKIAKKISLVVLIVFYFVAGCNHFRAPASYYHIIPPYLPWPVTINILAGIFELLFALMLIFRQTRRIAAIGIIVMLAAFLPTHIYMLQKAPMHMGDIVVTPFIAWVRLIILQPLLMLWAGWYLKTDNRK